MTENSKWCKQKGFFPSYVNSPGPLQWFHKSIETQVPSTTATLNTGPPKQRLQLLHIPASRKEDGQEGCAVSLQGHVLSFAHISLPMLVTRTLSQRHTEMQGSLDILSLFWVTLTCLKRWVPIIKEEGENGSWGNASNLCHKQKI